MTTMGILIRDFHGRSMVKVCHTLMKIKELKNAKYLPIQTQL